MSHDDLAMWSATQIAAAIRTREISPVEATTAALEHIERFNPAVNAFVTVVAEEALTLARQREQQVLGTPTEDLPALHGVPVSVKDLTPTAGVRTTFGSRHYIDHVPDEDALAWARAKAAGAILIGKTTTPEFGWLAITDSPLTGVTGNPWAPDRVSGGSSGGAAVATALGMGYAGLGSDGAGSIRIPASMCGIVGFKATCGRVPITGEDLVYSTTEVMGPLTRTVDDAALLLSVMAGPDQREAYPLDALSDVTGSIRTPVGAGTRVGFVPTFGDVTVEPGVQRVIAEAVEAIGTVIDVVDYDLNLLDPLDHMLRYWRPAMALFMDDLRERGMDLPQSHPILLQLAEEGRRVSGSDHWQASVVDRGVMKAQIAQAFDRVDLLLMPTLPCTAFPHPGADGGPREIAGRPIPVPFIGFAPFTAPFNMTGNPALSIPCGLDERGMPVGLQIVGRFGADVEVLRFGRMVEDLLGFDLRPPLLEGAS
jgi:aspartyl-tRNA(Asn)/glutamyl-tRNA(Gln) amidotransferase subunit A